MGRQRVVTRGCTYLMILDGKEDKAVGVLAQQRLQSFFGVQGGCHRGLCLFDGIFGLLQVRQTDQRLRLDGTIVGGDSSSEVDLLCRRARDREILHGRGSL